MYTAYMYSVYGVPTGPAPQYLGSTLNPSTTMEVGKGPLDHARFEVFYELRSRQECPTANKNTQYTCNYTYVVNVCVYIYIPAYLCVHVSLLTLTVWEVLGNVVRSSPAPQVLRLHGFSRQLLSLTLCCLSGGPVWAHYPKGPSIILVHT